MARRDIFTRIYIANVHADGAIVVFELVGRVWEMYFDLFVRSVINLCFWLVNRIG